MELSVATLAYRRVAGCHGETRRHDADDVMSRRASSVTSRHERHDVTCDVRHTSPHVIGVVE